MSGWIHGDLDRAMPGGYNGQTFVTRFDSAITNIAAAHGGRDTLLVVSHGAAIRAWVGMRVDGADGAGSVEDRWLSNTGMITLEGDPSAGWNLIAWHSAPLGGPTPPAIATQDVTGAPVREAISE